MVKLNQLTDFVTMTNAAKRLGISRQRMHVLAKKHGANPIRVTSRLSLLPISDFNRIEKDRKTRGF